jgi:5-methyltetrahydropteroyltriglutamate--homocysteine methyltransferase
MSAKASDGSRISVEIAGIYSRSENLVKVTRDYDRGRANESALSSAFVKDTEDLYELQLESGFANLSDGQLRWQDFLRPFSESLDGMESGADLSRWFDTNTFYKKPKITKKIGPKDGPFLTEARYSRGSSRETNSSIAIPGPYTLASLVEDKFYNSKEELVRDFAKALKQIISSLEASGFSSIQINEPSLVFRYGESALTNPKHLEFFCSAFAENLGMSKANLTLHTNFGDSSKILKELIALPGVSAVGIDFTQTPLGDLSSIQFDEKRLSCGCVDSRSSLVESPEWIAEFCALALKKLSPSGLVIIPSSDLKYLPRIYADKKVRAIGEAAKLVHADHSS